MRREVAVLIVGAALLGACAQPGDVDGSGSGAPPDPPLAAEPEDIVFQVTTGGGFVDLDVHLTTMPSLTVYGDGRALVVDPGQGWSPGDMLPVAAGRVDDGEMDALVGAAQSSGLFDGDVPDFGTPAITDVGGTTVTFDDGHGAAVTVDAYALDEYGDDYSHEGNLDDAQRERRRALRGLITAAEEAVDDTTPYQPDRLRVFDMTGHGSFSDDSPDGSAVDWPGPDFDALFADTADADDDDFDPPCAAVQGADATAVADAAAGRATGTRWRDGSGDVRALVLRPLLPGEPDCLPPD
jgi:hypothetical protein